MTGYYRIHNRAVWHKWETWAYNEFIVIPSCGSEMMLKASAAKGRLRQRAELPPNARICKDCEKRAA